MTEASQLADGQRRPILLPYIRGRKSAVRLRLASGKLSMLVRTATLAVYEWVV